jgi:hypothetical protein
VKKENEAKLARERVPSREELKKAKEWCLTNDIGLWDAIVKATITMLRKSDFKKVNENGQTSGLQAKTGRKFKIRVELSAPTDLTNWRNRWDKLREYMDWKTEGTETHTVWHDLKHWGPTILGELGYTEKQIQTITGHATSSMANRYTNLRAEKLQEAVTAVKKEMESL